MIMPANFISQKKNRNWPLEKVKTEILYKYTYVLTLLCATLSLGPKLDAFFLNGYLIHYSLANPLKNKRGKTVSLKFFLFFTGT